MANQLWMRLLAAFFAAWMCCAALPAEAGAEPVMITVCGESKNGDAAAAEVHAQKLAVGRVLSKIILPDRDPSSIFQAILNDYKKYAGKMKVEKKRTHEGTLYLIGKVPVDAEALRKAAESSIGSKQENHLDAEACFAIQVTGADDPAKARLAATKTYQYVFDGLGLQATGADEVEHLLASGMSGAALAQRVMQDHPEITSLVQGDIKLVEVNASANLWRAEIHITASDMLKNGQVYADFDDVYEIKAKNRAEAQELLVQKSAYNSSRVIADRTLDYWRK